MSLLVLNLMSAKILYVMKIIDKGIRIKATSMNPKSFKTFMIIMIIISKIEKTFS